jgi:membrane-associated phospholipid phosphatase
MLKQNLPAAGEAQPEDVAVAGAKRLTIALLFAIGAMFLFGELAHQMLEGATRRFDAAAVTFFQRHQLPVVHQAMLAVSWIAGAGGLTLIVIAVLAILIRRQHPPGDAVALLTAFPGGMLIVAGLKYLFHRPRPTLIFAGHVKYTGYSFPSGHSFCAIVVFGLLAYWLAAKATPWRRRGFWIASICFIFLVGFSRVFLGAHYPSDVIGGFAVGYPWLWGCLALSEVLKNRADRRPLGPHRSPPESDAASARPTG